MNMDTFAHPAARVSAHYAVDTVARRADSCSTEVDSSVPGGPYIVGYAINASGQISGCARTSPTRRAAHPDRCVGSRFVRFG
jgi:hypothetical protein